MNTLITGATSAEAHKLKNKLNTDNIILGDYLELPAFMLTAANMVSLPRPDSPSYAHEMLTLCLDRDINMIYAVGDKEKVLLKQAEQLFTEYGITVISDSGYEL